MQCSLSQGRIVIALFSVAMGVAQMIAGANVQARENCPQATDSFSARPTEVGHPAYYLPAVVTPGRTESIAITVWRSDCGASAATPKVWLRMTTERSAMLVPQVTVVQDGRALGCFSPWTTSCPEFTWAPKNAATIFRQDMEGRPLRGSMAYPLTAVAQASPFDPARPFELHARWDWPAKVPALVLHVPAAGVPGNVGEVPTDIVGTWHNSNEPGWGLIVDRNERGIVFAALMTFDVDGQSTWYFMSNGQPQGEGVVAGDLYRSRGKPYRWIVGQPENFEPGEPVGRLRLQFAGTESGRVEYQVGNITGQSDIARLRVIADDGSDCNSLEGVWAPREGTPLGMTGAVRPGCRMHATLLTYDSERNPVWYFAPMAYAPSTYYAQFSTRPGLDGPLLRVTGTPLGAPYDPLRLSLQAEGQLIISQDGCAVLLGRSINCEGRRFRFEF